MKGLEIRLKNRRIQILKDSETIYLRFKKLIDKSEIDDYKKHHTCKMVITKNIVETDVYLSIDAAYDLMCLLQDIFNKKKL